jgi:NAD(P)-dependent dehydrogenase (short-subunit alcohol dehydrogenase family)
MTLEEAKGSFIKSDQGLSLPEEIAPSFLFLASDQLSRKVTGHILLTDNGFAAMRL